MSDTQKGGERKVSLCVCVCVHEQGMNISRVARWVANAVGFMCTVG